MSEKAAYAVYQNQQRKTWLIPEETTSVTTGGGIPGQGYTCILETDDMKTNVFTLDADSSNSMKSGNPHSGIHEAFFAKTLDTTTPTPQKAQGGQMIVSDHDGGAAMEAGRHEPKQDLSMRKEEKPPRLVFFNGGGFGQRVASYVCGPITTHEEGIRGDTKVVVQVHDDDDFTDV